MTTEEIRKCKKNGVIWTSYHEIPSKICRNLNGVLHKDGPRREWEDACASMESPNLHPTRFAAQAAIEERIKSVPSESSETPAEKDARIKALVDGYKAKAEAEPLEWCERKVGEPSEKSDDRTVSSTVDLQAPLLGCLGTNGKDGNRICGSDGWVFPRFGGWDEPLPAGGRARYRNPLWLAKHGKPVESHETPVGETQTTVLAEVVDEAMFVKNGGTPTTVKMLDAEESNKEPIVPVEVTPIDVPDVAKSSNKPTTVRGWLETIPDAAIREAALRQCANWSKNCMSLAWAITELLDWSETLEGEEFWRQCISAAKHECSWPAYPTKTKPVKDSLTGDEIEKATGLPVEHIAKVAAARKAVEDGWTPHEVGKAAFKPDAVSHPSHYTSHPSGVECITITKHMNFCRGNAMKYLWRAGQKGDSLDKEIEDIAKAEEYCRIEKERLIATKGAK